MNDVIGSVRDDTDVPVGICVLPVVVKTTHESTVPNVRFRLLLVPNIVHLLLIFIMRCRCTDAWLCGLIFYGVFEIPSLDYFTERSCTISIPFCDSCRLVRGFEQTSIEHLTVSLSKEMGASPGNKVTTVRIWFDVVSNSALAVSSCFLLQCSQYPELYYR